MSILGVDTKRKGFKLVGVSLPLQVHSQLTLYTLAKGIAKSTLFKTLIDDWLSDQKTLESEEELIQQLVIRINNEWQAEKTVHPRSSFNEFKAKLIQELEVKGLEGKQIHTVIKGIKEK